MANYTLSNLVKAQLSLAGNMGRQDMRQPHAEVWSSILKNTEQFLPNIQVIKTADNRAHEADYFKRTSRALGSGRTHNHTGTKGDTAVLTPTWLTKSDGFSSSLKQADNSKRSMQELLNNELENTVFNFMEGLNTLASDFLLNNRTGVNVAVTDGTFNATNDVFEITASTNEAQSVLIAEMVMKINKYKGQLTFYCDPIAFRKFLFFAAQGAQNATNYSFQFLGHEFILDISLTAKAGVISAGYATKGFFEVVQRGTVGALTWIPKQNRTGVETSVNMYSSILNPYDGQRYAVHSYETRIDGTSTNSQTQDVSTETQLSIDVALEKAPLSVATETTIYAFALV